MTIASLAGARVLVTGSSGFIGGHLAEALLGSGADVHLVSRRHTTGLGSVCHVCDLADGSSTSRLLALVRPDIVFHLAGHVTGDRTLEAVLPTLQANMFGTVNVLSAAVANGLPRVVLPGSMEEPASNDPSGLAAHPYAASKAAASIYARMFAALFDLETVLLRIFLVYGRRQTDEEKLVPYVIRSLLAGDSPLLTRGERLIDWVYIDDVVASFMAAATKGPSGSTIDIGSGALHSVRDVVERIAALVDPSCALEFGQAPVRPNEHSQVNDKDRSWPMYDIARPEF